MGHSRERTVKPGGAERDERARSAPQRPERVGQTFEPRGAELEGLGNRSLLALMRAGRFQARRRVSQPGDPREVEADRAAEKVVSGERPARPRAAPEPAVVQRAPTEDEALANALGLGPTGSPGRAEPGAAPQPPPPPEDSNTGTRGLFEGLHGGRALDEGTRSLMESRFGESFSQVRVHTGPHAEEVADSVSAHAFTVGDDIVFGKGQFAPDSSAGQRLLAHELAHVVQQRNAAGWRAPEETAEAEADGAAHDVERDRPIQVEMRAEPGSVQRKDKEEQWGFSRPTSSVHGTTVEVNGRPMAYMNQAESMQNEGSTWDPAKRLYGVSVSVLSRLRPWTRYSTAEADARRDNLVVVITGRSRFDNKTLTVTIGSKAPPKKPGETPPPPGPEEPGQEKPEEPPTDTRSTSHAKVQKVEQQSKDDPKGALKDARDLSKEELGSLGAGPRQSLLNAAADSSTATTAPNLPRDLINTTPDRDAGALSDALKADGGKLLKDLKANESDSEAAADLEAAAWDLDARRLDAPAPDAQRDIPDFTPEMKKKADEIRGLLTKIGRRTSNLDENMEGRPEWSRVKDKMDQDFQRQLRNLDQSVRRWNTEHTTPGGFQVDSASAIATEARAELDKALEAMKVAKTERELFEGWKQARRALRRGTDAMDAKEKLEQFQSSVRTWNETQSGWASLAAGPSHLMAGVSMDRPDQIAAQARVDIEAGLALLRDAKTPEEQARASVYLQQAVASANRELYLHKEAVYGGAEDVIVGIKVTAVVTTAIVAAPVAASYGAGAVTLKVVGTGIVVGAVGGGTLSAARQGVQIMEGSRKEFSFGEVGMGAAGGGLAGGLVVLAPEAVPLFMGMGVASSAEEFSQGHYATGAFDFGTAMLPIAIKGGPGAIRWARPRIAAGMLRMGTGLAEVPSLGGNTYTPNIPGVAMVAEAGGPMGNIPGGSFAVPEIGAIPEGLPVGSAAPKPAVNAGPGVWQTVSPFGTALPGYQIPYVVQIGAPSTAATPATPAAPTGMPIMLGAAKTQMKAEGDYKNLVGAAGEGSYMGSLTARGAPNVNMNEFAGSAMNTPHLDVASNEALAQVKVRGSPGNPSKSVLRTYKKDFLKLVDPESDSEGIAAGRRKAETVANILANNRAAIQSRGAWPQGLKPNATVPEILQYMRDEAVLAIPSDHVPAVRAAVAADALANPETYGLKPGPNLAADVQRLTARIQSVGLTRKSLGTIESDYRSGIDTQSIEE